jgi:hypothetical protein
MKIRILFFFIILLGFIPSILFAQVKGKILDAENLEPICYAVISWDKGSNGVISNVNGEFEVIDQVVDSLLISAMAFRDTSVCLKSFGNHEVILYLERQIFELPIVEIKSGILSQKEFQVSTRKSISIGGGTSEFNFSVGTEFNNSQLGFIESVSIFFDQVKKRKQENKILRLRILGFNDENYPEYDLLTQFIELQPRRKNRWLTIDLREYDVRLNEKNFLVAIEFIKNPDISVENDPNEILSGWFIGLSEIPADQKGLLRMWDKLDGRPWGKAPNYPIKNVTPMIKVSAMVLKQ